MSAVIFAFAPGIGPALEMSRHAGKAGVHLAIWSGIWPNFKNVVIFAIALGSCTAVPMLRQAGSAAV